jgi:predicted transcriptional regulator
MPARNKPDEKMDEVLVVEKLEDMRLIFSIKHNMILNLLTMEEMSISGLAKSLDMNPGSVHYHLKELEKHGLVRQVREEIKGGIVKKFYRSTAKRILLQSPNFYLHRSLSSESTRDYLDRLIRSIEYLGYHLPPGNEEDAKELLERYDKRIKSLLQEMQDSGLDNIENNGLILDTVYHLLLNIEAKDDPELGRLYREFEKLFQRYE